MNGQAICRKKLSNKWQKQLNKSSDFVGIFRIKNSMLLLMIWRLLVPTVFLSVRAESNLGENLSRENLCGNLIDVLIPEYKFICEVCVCVFETKTFLFFLSSRICTWYLLCKFLTEHNKKCLALQICKSLAIFLLCRRQWLKCSVMEHNQ